MELSILLAVVVFISAIMRILKQPLIIGYILTGILLSPNLLNVVRASDAITAFSQIGVALLLFLVGLNLNPKIIREVGKVSIVAGLGQVILTTGLGFLFAILLGFGTTTAFYIGLGLAFSSTIIVSKLLADKQATETLYGRIAIGFLIVQDLVVIFALMILSSTSGQSSFLAMAFNTLLRGAGLILFLVGLSVYVLPTVMKHVAKSQEFLFLFSLGWALAISSLFYALGFSVEIGSLLAGVTLSVSTYRFEISSRLKPLRDFFIMIFFILLGSQMVFANVAHAIIPIVLLSLFVLIGKPLIVLALMGSMGYTRRNGFLTGAALAQISAFSLILIALGVSLGQVGPEAASVVTMVGIITIAGSTYFINYSERLYLRLSRFLKVFERSGEKIDEHKRITHETYDIILFGYNRIGYDLLESFKRIEKQFLVVDYNPEVIRKLAADGVDCRYGDVSDTELLNEIDFAHARMLISTIPDLDINLLLISRARDQNKAAIIIVVSHQIEEAMKLYDEGATYVVMPHFLGGHHASMMIEEYGFDLEKFLEEKVTHVEHLRKRRAMGHEHPKHVNHEHSMHVK